MRYRMERYDGTVAFNELHYPLGLDGWRVHSVTATVSSWIVVLWEKDDKGTE